MPSLPGSAVWVPISGSPVVVARASSAPAGFAHPDEGRQIGVANVGIDLVVGIEHRRAEREKAKATAALPVHGLADAALLAFDNLLQSRQAVRDGVLAHLDADPAPAHLVRDGGGVPLPRKESRTRSFALVAMWTIRCINASGFGVSNAAFSPNSRSISALACWLSSASSQMLGEDMPAFASDLKSLRIGVPAVPLTPQYKRPSACSPVISSRLCRQQVPLHGKTSSPVYGFRIGK